jgi:hypothetical protein
LKEVSHDQAFFGRIDLHAGETAGFDALLTKLVRLKAQDAA